MTNEYGEPIDDSESETESEATAQLRQRSKVVRAKLRTARTALYCVALVLCFRHASEVIFFLCRCTPYGVQPSK